MLIVLTFVILLVAGLPLAWTMGATAVIFTLILFGPSVMVMPELGKSWGGFVLLFVVGDVGSLLFTICTNPLRMRLSDKRVAATQFTLYNSLANIVVPAKR